MLTRTVGETAALLDVLAGYEVGDANWARARSSLLELGAPTPAAAIAITDRQPARVDVDPECVRGMHQAAELLARSATRSRRPRR